MPNKEEKKHFLKRKKDTSKKADKYIPPILSNSLDDLTEVIDIGSRKHIHDNHQIMKDQIGSVGKHEEFVCQPCAKSTSHPYSCRVVTAHDRISKVDDNHGEYNKRRQSKSHGTKYFFFPFFKKNSDISGQLNKDQSLSSKARSVSNFDSSESSNTSFSSASSLFSASQYLYSTRSSMYDATCVEPSSSFGKQRRNSCNSSSYIIKKLQNDYRGNYEMRPNSIAFPLLPPPHQSSVSIPTCNDGCIRHSIAAMPRHYQEFSGSSVGNSDAPIGAQSEHFMDKCISYPSLDGNTWNTVNPSHPDYPQVAKSIMYSARSQFSPDTRYYQIHHPKRKSLPSDGDSGVALDHHKRSMVFSGYNGFLSVEPSTVNLSLSSTSDYETLQIDESNSRSSNEFDFSTVNSGMHQPRDSSCTTTSPSISMRNTSFLDYHISKTNLDEVYSYPYQVCNNEDYQSQNIQRFYATQESYYTLTDEVPLENHSGLRAITYSNNQKPELSEEANFPPIQRNFLLPCENYQINTYYKSRRVKSLKNHSYPDRLPHVSQNENYIHGREISFYTYIAPDPNHSKEIPKWLQDYSEEESLLQFAWSDSHPDDLLCWITLLGRLYKKELEALIRKYEECRDDLISIIDERSGELVEERIALEKALISEETYV